jgi:hypothetical protein
MRTRSGRLSTISRTRTVTCDSRPHACIARLVIHTMILFSCSALLCREHRDAGATLVGRGSGRKRSGAARLCRRTDRVSPDAPSARRLSTPGQLLHKLPMCRRRSARTGPAQADRSGGRKLCTSVSLLTPPMFHTLSRPATSPVQRNSTGCARLNAHNSLYAARRRPFSCQYRPWSYWRHDRSYIIRSRAITRSVTLPLADKPGTPQPMKYTCSRPFPPYPESYLFVLDRQDPPML